MNSDVSVGHLKDLIRMKNGVNIDLEPFGIHLLVHVGLELGPRYFQVFMREVFLKTKDDFLTVQAREIIQDVEEVVKIAMIARDKTRSCST
jgi:hypothetical protein